MLQVVTDLRGKTHSRFFVETLAKVGGLPAHVSLDHAPAWNGVNFILSSIFADTKKATPLVVDREVRYFFLLLFVYLSFHISSHFNNLCS